ncbi:MAG: integrase core domain-containing protein [Acidimicrobiia bacterium]
MGHLCKVFASLEEAQAALDVWIEHYNTERPHQRIGMVPPLRRFDLSVAEPFELIEGETEGDVEEQILEPGLVAAPR